jgi:hypothetical protein
MEVKLSRPFLRLLSLKPQLRTRPPGVVVKVSSFKGKQKELVTSRSKLHVRKENLMITAKLVGLDVKDLSKVSSTSTCLGDSLDELPLEETMLAA